MKLYKIICGKCNQITKFELKPQDIRCNKGCEGRYLGSIFNKFENENPEIWLMKVKSELLKKR